jgi:glycosyltransferase involved in cell wall biosynthesis
MKITVIGHNFVVAENQKHLAELIKLDKNVSLTLITPKWWNENTRKTYQERISPTTFKILTGRTLFTGHNTLAFYIWGLLNPLIKSQAEIIEVFEEPWSLTLLQVILIKKILRLNGKITCYSAQNINKKFPFPFNLIEKFNIKNIAGLHVCSDSVKDVVETKYSGKAVQTIGLGLDFTNFTFKDKDLSNPIRLGYVGRIAQAKGVFDLAEAMQSLPNCTLQICGSGEALSQLQKYIATNNLNDKISLNGSLGIKEIINFYHQIDILVVPSKTTKTWKEQFGRIIIEALACGTLVIGADSGSIPEVIGQNGLVYKEGNIEDLIQKINLLIKDYSQWQKNKKNALKQITTDFAWEAIAKKYYNFYKEILNENRI